jgi:hypothetical protein
MNEQQERKDPKQTEEERIKQVRERIRNSDIFVVKTQPGKGTAMSGACDGVRMTRIKVINVAM